MHTVLRIVGWVGYGLVALYALSGLFFISRAARTGGSVSYTGLFQWACATVCVALFAATSWSKLHLLWIVPAGFLISHTPLGTAVGNIVGLVTVVLFGGSHGTIADARHQIEQLDLPSVACSECGAGVGQSCRDLPTDRFHRARWQTVDQRLGELREIIRRGGGGA